MTRRLLVAALLAACVAAALAGSRVGSAGGDSSPVAASARDAAVSLAAQLAAAPAVDRFALDAGVPAAAVRPVADQLAGAVPLPAGGTFAGVRWEAMGGTLARAEITAILQYNAACQWLRAWRDGREPGVADRVLAEVPAWPAWRGGDGAEWLAAVLVDVRSGGGDAAAGALRECDASHARETEYAESLGLKASA